MCVQYIWIAIVLLFYCTVIWNEVFLLLLVLFRNMAMGYENIKHLNIKWNFGNFICLLLFHKSNNWGLLKFEYKTPNSM